MRGQNYDPPGPPWSVEADGFRPPRRPSTCRRAGRTHWVALYLSSSIKSSASKARSPYDSISAYIPETPSRGAEVALHCPCQVAEASEGLPPSPFFAESGTDDRPDADPTTRFGTSCASVRTCQAPRRVIPRASPPARTRLNWPEGLCCMGGNRGAFTGTQGGVWSRRSTTGNPAGQR